MKLKKALNEIQAEIVNGKIPANKVFAGDNIASLEKGSEWRRVLGEILVAIKNAGLEGDFKKDLDPLDIAGEESPIGKIQIKSDSGVRYYYDVNKKKFFKYKEK